MTKDLVLTIIRAAKLCGDSCSDRDVLLYHLPKEVTDRIPDFDSLRQKDMSKPNQVRNQT
jgi:hypothetical protein